MTTTMIPIDPHKLPSKGRPVDERTRYFKELVYSINKRGQLLPIRITSTGGVINGKHRVIVAKILGIDVMCEDNRDTRMFLESTKLTPVEEYLLL